MSTKFYLKSDVILLTCAFENSIKVSVIEFGLNLLICVSLPGFTWLCGFNYTDVKLQTFQDE